MFRGDEVIVMSVDEAEAIVGIAGAHSFGALMEKHHYPKGEPEMQGIRALDDLRCKAIGIRLAQRQR